MKWIKAWFVKWMTKDRYQVCGGKSPLFNLMIYRATRWFSCNTDPEYTWDYSASWAIWSQVVSAKGCTQDAFTYTTCPGDLGLIRHFSSSSLIRPQIFCFDRHRSKRGLCCMVWKLLQVSVLCEGESEAHVSLSTTLVSTLLSHTLET